MINDKVLAFDFESYYDDECSITTLGLYHYTHHYLFEAYMLSVVGSDGFEWCGHPDSAPWDKFREYDTWVAHNLGFDKTVLERLIELGKAPADIMPKEMNCTANMSVYFGLPRALAQIVGVVYNHTVDKSIRNVDMKGLHRQDMTDELYERVLKYALDDSRWCLKLWQDFGAEWPEMERWLSNHTIECGKRGVCVDLPALEADIDYLNRVIEHNLALLPWVNRGYTPLSRKGVKEECELSGIPMPESLAKTSEECEEWEDAFGDKYPWVRRMRTWRRTNALLKKFETIRSRMMPNGRMEFSLLYFGASTGRWSGAGKFNMQNLARAPFYFDAEMNLVETPTDKGIDMRSKFIATEGKVFIAPDLSQVEPRCLSALAGDTIFIQKIREGYGPYEAAARATMGWTGGNLKKENPQMYLLSKARTLALGFSAGWFKFLSMAKLYVGDEAFDQIFKIKPSDEDTAKFLEYLGWLNSKKPNEFLKQWPILDEQTQWTWVQSWKQVTDFRAGNPKIIALWKKLGDGLAASVGGTYEIGLPSGRVLRYFNVAKSSDGFRVRTTRGGQFSRAYSGLLTENLVQATARDVFANCMRNLENAGFPIVFTVHDEAILEVPEGTDPKVIEKIMAIPPTWMKSLPLGSEANVSKHYTK